MSSSNLKMVILTDDNKFVSEDNQEIPIGSIIYCLGSLFKQTSSGLSHVVGKIDDHTYFADPKYFHKLNDLAFPEQTEVTSTPETALQREGLLASAYRLMTAPFSIRTLKNVTARTRTRKSNPVKLVSIIEGTGIITQSEEQNDSMKIPPPNEMFLFNAQCEKSISQEVQFYFKSYQEFITSSNQRLITVINALNAMNIGHYNDLKIKYPGFILELPVIDINRLTSVIQRVYPMQVLQYSLGDSMKERPSMSQTMASENEENVGLFPPNGKNQEKLHIDQLVEDMNEEINERGSYQPPDGQGINCRGRLRSPESKTHRERYRYDVTDRRYRYDNYANKSDSSNNSQLIA